MESADTANYRSILQSYGSASLQGYDLASTSCDASLEAMAARLVGELSWAAEVKDARLSNVRRVPCGDARANEKVLEVCRRFADVNANDSYLTLGVYYLYLPNSGFFFMKEYQSLLSIGFSVEPLSRVKSLSADGMVRGQDWSTFCHEDKPFCVTFLHRDAYQYRCEVTVDNCQQPVNRTDTILGLEFHVARPIDD